MRALKYRLENGTIVNSMSQAKANGQKYEVFVEKIRENNRDNISPVRKAMLEQFGYAHPSLKDKVVLNQWRRPLKQGRFFMPKNGRTAGARLRRYYPLYHILQLLSIANLHKFEGLLILKFVHFFMQLLLTLCRDYGIIIMSRGKGSVAQIKCSTTHELPFVSKKNPRHF